MRYIFFNLQSPLIFGFIGAFLARIPDVGLFEIGLGTPISSAVQILLCLGAYRWYRRRAAQ